MLGERILNVKILQFMAFVTCCSRNNMKLLILLCCFISGTLSCSNPEGKYSSFVSQKVCFRKEN